ncbi:endonuclease/exonuclease/phosphatase family protein [Qipengyuania spongiae]|uniref:Endonuclease/exonuclease/phosphatase family protein n=1 Tax=Qipengyuania spongiae TaxID=2909673 RepID=A0ABY5T2E6_9SPHN|nr:endonuclease/exonuclease/phosphatase family protein [Qipengyuania spongiae]UVI40694.1 endonuclease/exonuclease/phosphatase family protein [Qipengyuania spongiae]
MLDFVREPSIYLAALIGVLAVFFVRRGRWVAIALLAGTVAINLARIWPYSFLAPAQIPLPDHVDGMSCAKVLSLNVLQTNDRYQRTADLIDRVDPDIVLLMETNGQWLDALEPQLSRYGYRLERLLDNTYGMIFATKLDVDRAAMVSATDTDTPTLYATLRTDDGARFEVVGLHPRPPRPGRSTENRDAIIARAGARTPDRLSNVLAIGDFNDVPWSRTTQNFREEGGYLDPRAGRGSYATFPASLVTFGWPLDQIMVKDGVKVESLEIGPDVGSDHLPLLARVCVDPAAGQSDAPDAALRRNEGEAD